MKTPKKLLITSAVTLCGFGLAFGQQTGQAEGEAQQPGAAQEQPPVLQEEQDQNQEAEFGERPARDRQTTGIKTGESHKQAESYKASELEGSRVENQEGDRLGTVDSVAMDLESGELSFIVVSSGGFLGIGDELKLVPPDAIDIEREEGIIMGGLIVKLDISEDEWEQAPSVKDREEIAQYAQEERGREVYQHYGVEWEQRAAVEFGGRDRQERQDQEFGSPVRDEDNGELKLEEDEIENRSSGVRIESDEQEYGARIESDEQGSGVRVESEEREYGVRKDKENSEIEIKAGEKHDQQEFGARAAHGKELSLSTDLQGQTLVGSQEDEEIGKIDDLLVDIENGQVTFILISPETDFGEGGGDQTYAIAPQAITMLEEDRYQVNISRQQFEQAQRLTQAEIQDHARRHAMEPQQARTQPQVFRFDAEDEDAIFGRPDRKRDAESQKDKDDGLFDRSEDDSAAPEHRGRESEPRQPGQPDRL